MEAAKLASSDMAFKRRAARVTRGMLGRGSERLVPSRQSSTKLRIVLETVWKDSEDVYA